MAEDEGRAPFNNPIEDFFGGLSKLKDFCDPYRHNGYDSGGSTEHKPDEGDDEDSMTLQSSPTLSVDNIKKERGLDIMQHADNDQEVQGNFEHRNVEPREGEEKESIEGRETGGELPAEALKAENEMCTVVNRCLAPIEEEGVPTIASTANDNPSNDNNGKISNKETVTGQPEVASEESKNDIPTAKDNAQPPLKNATQLFILLLLCLAILVAVWIFAFSNNGIKLVEQSSSTIPVVSKTPDHKDKTFFTGSNCTKSEILRQKDWVADKVSEVENLITAEQHKCKSFLTGEANTGCYLEHVQNRNSKNKLWMSQKLSEMEARVANEHLKCDSDVRKGQRQTEKTECAPVTATKDSLKRQRKWVRNKLQEMESNLKSHRENCINFLFHAHSDTGCALEVVQRQLSGLKDNTSTEIAAIQDAFEAPEGDCNMGEEKLNRFKQQLREQREWVISKLAAIEEWMEMGMVESDSFVDKFAEEDETFHQEAAGTYFDEQEQTRDDTGKENASADENDVSEDATTEALRVEPIEGGDEEHVDLNRVEGEGNESTDESAGLEESTIGELYAEPIERGGDDEEHVELYPVEGEGNESTDENDSSDEATIDELYAEPSEGGDEEHINLTRVEVEGTETSGERDGENSPLDEDRPMGQAESPSPQEHKRSPSQKTARESDKVINDNNQRAIFDVDKNLNKGKKNPLSRLVGHFRKGEEPDCDIQHAQEEIRKLIESTKGKVDFGIAD